MWERPPPPRRPRPHRARNCSRAAAKTAPAAAPPEPWPSAWFPACHPPPQREARAACPICRARAAGGGSYPWGGEAWQRYMVGGPKLATDAGWPFEAPAKPPGLPPPFPPGTAAPLFDFERPCAATTQNVNPCLAWSGPMGPLSDVGFQTAHASACDAGCFSRPVLNVVDLCKAHQGRRQRGSPTTLERPQGTTWGDRIGCAQVAAAGVVGPICGAWRQPATRRRASNTRAMVVVAT